MTVRVLRAEFHGLAVSQDGLPILRLALQGGAEVVMGVGVFRIQFDRPAEAVGCVIIILHDVAKDGAEADVDRGLIRAHVAELVACCEDALARLWQVRGSWAR